MCTALNATSFPPPPPPRSQSLDLLLPRHFPTVVAVSMVVSKDCFTEPQNIAGIYNQLEIPVESLQIMVAE